MSTEALTTSEIEGEILDRARVESSSHAHWARRSSGILTVRIQRVALNSVCVRLTALKHLALPSNPSARNDFDCPKVPRLRRLTRRSTPHLRVDFFAVLFDDAINTLRLF